MGDRVPERLPGRFKAFGKPDGRSKQSISRFRRALHGGFKAVGKASIAQCPLRLRHDFPAGRNRPNAQTPPRTHFRRAASGFAFPWACRTSASKRWGQPSVGTAKPGLPSAVAAGRGRSVREFRCLEVALRSGSRRLNLGRVWVRPMRSVDGRTVTLRQARTDSG